MPATNVINLAIERTRRRPGHSRRRTRIAILYRKLLEWRADYSLLQANRALERCTAVIREETRAWAQTDKCLKSLEAQLELRVSVALLTVTGVNMLPALNLPAMVTDSHTANWTADLAELNRTATLVRVVNWATKLSWKAVEEMLPGNQWLRYDLGQRALTAAGVDVDAEQRRLNEEMVSLRFGIRLNLAVRVEQALSGQVATALYTWSDARSPRMPNAASLAPRTAGANG
jgi:hypothetical protein